MEDINMILQPVKSILVTEVTSADSAELASPKVIARQLRGRHAVTVIGSTTGIWIGAKGVTTAAGGMKLGNGEKITIPLDSITNAPLYFVGSGTLVEYF